MAYRINTEGCKLCGNCMSACPEGAISKNIETGQMQIDPDKCISCDVCACVCGEGCIIPD